MNLNRGGIFLPLILRSKVGEGAACFCLWLRLSLEFFIQILSQVRKAPARAMVVKLLPINIPD